MKSAYERDIDTSGFWLRHPDSTQAAVHLALQWLAFVYPTSADHLESTLRGALPYTDDELSRRWAAFLETKDVEEHVEALRWLSSTLSREQRPFLIESCWRLLLVNHEMPSQVPLALRLLGRVLKIPEFQILDIGSKVEKEIEHLAADTPPIPLMPEDPRYLDRVEWRLYDMNESVRRSSKAESSSGRESLRMAGAFGSGLLIGIAGLAFLVWGPPQWGREPIPRMTHQYLTTQPVPAENVSQQGPVTMTAQPEPEPPETGEDEVALSGGGLDQSTLPEVGPEDAEALAAPDAPATERLQEDATDGEERVVAVNDEESSPVAIVPAPETVQETAELPTIAENGSDQADVMMRITASLLNVRAAPSTDSDIIIKLGEGARVWMDPAGSQGSWSRVRVEGLVGYASSRFMEPVN